MPKLILIHLKVKRNKPREINSRLISSTPVLGRDLRSLLWIVSSSRFKDIMRLPLTNASYKHICSLVSLDPLQTNSVKFSMFTPSISVPARWMLMSLTSFLRTHMGFIKKRKDILLHTQNNQCIHTKNVSKATQEMPQSQNTAGTKRRRGERGGEEEVITKQMLHTTKEPPWNGQ